jgi:hypothetical protein
MRSPAVQCRRAKMILDHGSVHQIVYTAEAAAAPS